MSSNNQNIISSVNEKEVKQILDKQKFYNIVNILLSLLSHVINITSVILSFASTNNHNLSTISGILSGVLVIVMSYSQTMNQQILNNNTTLNKYITELKSGGNITAQTTSITPSTSNNNLQTVITTNNTPSNTPTNVTTNATTV